MANTYNSKNYFAHGGEQLVIGGKLTFLDGAEVENFPGSTSGTAASGTTPYVADSEATTVSGPEGFCCQGGERMKQVNAALKDIGIPVYAGVWRATSPNQNPPVQYCVYSTTTTEASHHDDHVTSLRTYVYLNLWSDIDPTDMADTIRQAMYAYGFFMVEESDKGYNQPAYDTATRQYTVQWTWCWREDVDYGN